MNQIEKKENPGIEFACALERPQGNVNAIFSRLPNGCLLKLTLQ